MGIDKSRKRRQTIFEKKLDEKLSSKKNPNYIKAINIINKYFTN